MNKVFKVLDTVWSTIVLEITTCLVAIGNFVSGVKSLGLAIWLWLALIVALIWGYVSNFSDVINHTGDFGILMIAKAIGMVVVPLGILLGWVA